MEAATPEDFYKALALVDEFRDVTSGANYRSLPQNWLLVITDVRGSTQAIQSGRYRDVNVIGASTIVAILNALPENLEVPYVFGGDGATLAIPPHVRGAVEQALKASQRLARERFQFELRTAIVPLADLRVQGTDVKVAKMRAGTSGGLAMFRGGGIALAESLVKNPETAQRYEIKPAENENLDGDFEGLQCRWDPVRSKSGVMLSLLVVARSANDEATTDVIYRHVVDKIEKIVGTTGSPIHRERLIEQVQARWLKFGSKEVKVRTHGLSLWQRLKYQVSVLYQMFALRWLYERKEKATEFDPEKYLTDLTQSTDFRKFDDTLRMILDCTPEQKTQIESYLENEFHEGNLFYGLHVSDSALMTCLVFNWSHHLHLVDGAGGGYAAAAIQLKKQMANAK